MSGMGADRSTSLVDLEHLRPSVALPACCVPFADSSCGGRLRLVSTPIGGFDLRPVASPIPNIQSTKPWERSEDMSSRCRTCPPPVSRPAQRAAREIHEGPLRSSIEDCHSDGVANSPALGRGDSRELHTTRVRCQPPTRRLPQVNTYSTQEYEHVLSVLMSFLVCVFRHGGSAIP